MKAKRFRETNVSTHCITSNALYYVCCFFVIKKQYCRLRREMHSTCNRFPIRMQPVYFLRKWNLCSRKLITQIILTIQCASTTRALYFLPRNRSTTAYVFNQESSIIEKKMTLISR